MGPRRGALDAFPAVHFLFLKRMDTIALRHIHDVLGAPGQLRYCASMCAQTGHNPARAAWDCWRWSDTAGGPKGAPTTMRLVA